VLDGLFVTPAVSAIDEALACLGERCRRIAVIGNAKLASALTTDRTVIPVGISGRAAAKLEAAGLAAPLNHEQLAAVEPGSLDAVVGVDITDDDHWHDTLGVWTRAVRDGGAVVIIGRGEASEASRRALCSGLTELEPRHAGRAVITSGLVTHL